MGFLDKVLGKVDLVKEKIQKALNGETMSNEEHPLADETVKKYYEIAYGLLASVWTDKKGSPYNVRYKGIKKYVEHFIGEQCDEEKLQKALSYFDCEGYNYGPTNATYSLFLSEYFVTSGYNIRKLSKFAANKIIETNRLLDEDTTYRCAAREEALEICYNISGVLNKVKAQYEEILVNFENRIGSFRSDVGDLINHCVKAYSDALKRDTIEGVIRDTTRDKFFEGDSNAWLLVVLSTYSLLSYDNRVASMALRAAHFEKYGLNEKDYTSFTDDECRKLVASEDVFMSELNKFADEDETNRFINEKIQHILSTDVFYNKTSDFWMPNKEDIYYTDKVCYEFWTDVATKENLDFSQDINTVFNTMLKYKKK